MASPNLSYERVEAFADTDEDWPGPRCGHTLTPIFANDFRKLVLFGGTNLADRNSLFGINLDGVTNSVHCFDIPTRTWRRLDTCGETPSPRASHAAATLQTYLFIQGGINLDGPCGEDVFVLDIASHDLRWCRLVVHGVTPGPRHGHVMVIVAQTWLVIFGGINGNVILSDTWALDLRSGGWTPHTWHRSNPSGNLPSGRMYASACVGRYCVFFLFGGIDRLGRSLRDVYRLEIYSITECRWATSEACVAPLPRYQHSAVFDGTRMHVFGGAVTWNNLVDHEAIVAVFNTQTGEWLERNLPENFAIRESQYQRMRRSLHAAAFIEGRIYVYGGRRSPDLLLEDFLVSESSHPPTPEPQVNSLSNGH